MGNPIRLFHAQDALKGIVREVEVVETLTPEFYRNPKAEGPGSCFWLGLTGFTTEEEAIQSVETIRSKRISELVHEIELLSTPIQIDRLPLSPHVAEPEAITV
jgi:hypothetical protein